MKSKTHGLFSVFGLLAYSAFAFAESSPGVLQPYELVLRPKIICEPAALQDTLNEDLAQKCRRESESQKICERVQATLLGGSPPSVRASLTAYGHRLKAFLFSEWGNYRYNAKEHLIFVDVLGPKGMAFEKLLFDLHDAYETAPDTWMEGEIYLPGFNFGDELSLELGLDLVNLRKLDKRRSEMSLIAY